MKVKISLLIIFLGQVLCSPVLGQAITWPEGKKAAIVLTYDDAVASHLQVAIPQLNKAKLRGTFFLDGRLSESQFSAWQEASRQGHELGNHTLYHACSERVLKATGRFATENYDIRSILREIEMMNKLIFGIDRKKVVSYAYPCSDTRVGGQDYADTLRQTKLVRFARVGGGKNAIITNSGKLDFMRVPSYAVADNSTGDELIAYVKSVQQQGGLGVIMFHGVGGDYLKVSAEAHAQLLQYLRAQQKAIWVGTFAEVLQYVADKSEKK